MSGERPSIAILAEADSVIARAVNALQRFPVDQPWVLIGGIAVFLRLEQVTRPTADADTVARSQTELLRTLEGDSTIVIAGGEVTFTLPTGAVDVDVMDLDDDPLHDDVERRAFALARRQALRSAIREQIVVTNSRFEIVANNAVPVATTSALVALKTVAAVRRPHGNSPSKVGSDIHDLVRLTRDGNVGEIAAELAVEPELARWVAAQVDRLFDRDLRYTLIRLRRFDNSVAAQALTDDEIGATSVLAVALSQALADSEER